MAACQCATTTPRSHRSRVEPYYLDLDETGIILEVERGKTTINNMDLLDFWKCHICVHAHYLILVVPVELRQNPTMTPRNEFRECHEAPCDILRAEELHECSRVFSSSATDRLAIDCGRQQRVELARVIRMRLRMSESLAQKLAEARERHRRGGAIWFQC